MDEGEDEEADAAHKPERMYRLNIWREWKKSFKIIV